MEFADESKQVGPRTFTWEKKDQRDNSDPVRTNSSLTAKLKKTMLGLAFAAGLYLGVGGTEQTPNTTITPREQQVESLRGHMVTGHRSDYTGGQRFVLDDKPDLEGSLETMWDAKERIASNDQAVDAVRDQQVATYDQDRSTKQSLDTYLESLHDEFEETYRATDFDKVGVGEGLSSEEVATVKTMLSKVSEETLGAYSMTELFPQEGRTSSERESAALLNKATYDYMLEHGGEEFVERIPAQYDSYLSFGPFQLTSWVVREDDRTGSANRMDTYLPGSFQVPGSMKHVEGEDHVHAAYGLLADHVVDVVDRADESGMDRLAELDERDLSLVAAGFHHRPDVAKDDVLGWAESNDSLSVSVFDGIESYVKQTGTNYDVLRSDATLEPHGFNHYFQQVGMSLEWDVYSIRSSQQRSPQQVASIFERLDDLRGDQCEPVGNLNIVNLNTVDGREDMSVYDGAGEMYIKARCD